MNEKLFFEPHNGYGQIAPYGEPYPFGYISTLQPVAPVFELMPVFRRDEDEMRRLAVAMAAAPELLEVVQDIVSDCEELINPGLYALAKEALAKAKGEA